MARVTSKRQVTIPKVIADRYGIAAGDDLDFVAAGDAIRVQRSADAPRKLDRAQRLALFDQATERLSSEQGGKRRMAPRDRGWQREDLYERARAR
jgi:AbrB family looped-hinge helix DNA binding protein